MHALHVCYFYSLVADVRYYRIVSGRHAKYVPMIQVYTPRSLSNLLGVWYALSNGYNV